MSPAKPEPPNRATPWDRLLEVAVLLVGVSGAFFVVAGTLTTSLFEWVVFGSAESPIPDGEAGRYVTFVYGVLGAVMIGWACLLWPLVRGPLRRREPWAWSAIAVSVGIWFVVDSTLSLASGFGENALLNLVFAIAFAVPLLAIRRRGLSS
jgi:hypothetical protein